MIIVSINNIIYQINCVEWCKRVPYLNELLNMFVKAAVYDRDRDGGNLQVDVYLNV